MVVLRVGADHRDISLNVGRLAQTVVINVTLPSNDTPPRRVIRGGEGGFIGDAEGICWLSPTRYRSILIVSDQGASQFREYDARGDNGGQTVSLVDAADILAWINLELE